jgi:DNA-binding SARP family transcriptional activator
MDAAESGLLEFRLLGPLEVWVEGRLLPVRGAKERALLAILLLDANQLVSTDRLIDELWGNNPPKRARNSLQVRVSNLRKALGATSRSAADDPLVSLGSGYVIRLKQDQLDLHQFERLLEEAEEALARHERVLGAEKLREALALWRGPALADFAYESFAQVAAARLEELRLVGLERRIEADLELGRHAELVGELEALVPRHPFRERLSGQLMLALYRSGRQAEALATYQVARRALVGELGIEPSPLLQELERGILRQDPALDLAGVSEQDRSILVAALEEDTLDSLLGLASALAWRPRHELILVRPLAVDGDVVRATSLLNQRREQLLSDGISVRTAAFTSARPGDELARIAAQQDVDLLLLDGLPEILDDPALSTVLERSPCDVAIFIARRERPAPGPVLVPFTGAEHDWAAVELGAWIASAWRSPLRLVGAAADPSGSSGDASRLLAHASLAVQRGLGVETVPLLIPPTPEELVRVAQEAALVVLGVPEAWRRGGLGPVRLNLARDAGPPTLLVRRGPRPGGLAPRESLTRFTWSLGRGTAQSDSA